MAWAWYPVKAVADTLLDGVPDETVEVNLEDNGTEIVRFLQSFSVGIIFKGFLLFPGINGRNPVVQNDEVGAMIFEDQYWVGINEGE